MNQDHIASDLSSSHTFVTSEPHHVLLNDHTWALWRWSVLRGAGFTVDYPLQLAAPACAAAADQLMLNEQSAQRNRDALIHLLTTIMDDEPTQRVFLGNIIQSLRKGKLPVGQNLPPSILEAIATLQTSLDRIVASRETYQTSFADALVQTTESLRFIVGLEPFRQALAWQNRQALHTGVKQFLEKPATTTSSQYRQHRMLMAKYLQRYSLKNDTIGFFGPVGWAKWMPEIPSSSLEPGSTLLAARTTYLECWGVNALSQTFLANPDVRPWAIPRLVPFAHLEGQTLHLPFVKPLPLSVAQARILSASDGTRTAQQLARALLAQGIPGLANEADVYAILDKLLTTRRISWDFDVPPEEPFPAQSLRQRLEMIAPTDLRTAALNKLAQLENAVAQVQQSVENADQLEHAIGQVEATFTALTNQSSTRFEGQLYAGRTLVYEDTTRNVQLNLGAELLEGMQQPLAGLLTSARWLAHALSESCKHFLHQLYEGLAAKNGSPIVEFTQFFPLVNAELFDEFMNPSQELEGPPQQLFQQKWAEVLGLPKDGRQLHYTSAELADHIATTFASPSPGWVLGHYHCPDIMLDAPSVEAINQGDFQYVMGELHLGMNTIDAPLFVRQHLHREDLFRTMAIDLPAPRIIPAISSKFLPATRIHQILGQPKDYRLVTVPEACEAPPAKSLRLGDLVVEADGETLIARTRDGRLRFDVMYVIGDYLSLAFGNSFGILAPQSHTPRITIDTMVVTREMWRMRTDEINFVQSSDLAENYAQVRAWAQSHGMPRFMFYRTPKEKKPCYLDLESPLYVELFLKDVRRMVNSESNNGFIVSLGEMLPAPDHTWLVDAQGNHYTSEIRIAAFDRKDDPQ